MSSLEELEQLDFKEYLQTKGPMFQSFKREYEDLERHIDIATANNTVNDKEYDSLFSELYTLKDQIELSKKNIIEINSSIESINTTNDNIINQRNSSIHNEKAIRNDIDTYNNQFLELKNLISRGYDWTPEQLEEKNTLDKEKDYIENKLNNKLNSINSLLNDVNNMYDNINDIENKIIEIDQSNDSINNNIKQFNKQTKSLSKQREDLEKQVYATRDNIKSIEDNIIELQHKYKYNEKSLLDVDGNLNEIKLLIEDNIKEYNQLYFKLDKLTNELENKKINNNKLSNDIKEREDYIKLKHNDINYYNNEINQLKSLINIINDKCLSIDNNKHKYDNKKDQLLNKINILIVNELNLIKKECESIDKQIVSYKSEIEILNKKFNTIDKANKAINSYIQLNNNKKLNLIVERNNYEDIINQKKENIKLLLNEKDKYDYEIEISNQQYYISLEELKLQELQIQELQKKINNDVIKLRYKQNLYESIRSDRNLYSKQYIQSQNNIIELKHTYQSLNYQIDQIKDEISQKDHSIIKEHFLHHSVNKEKELLKNDIIKTNKQITTSDYIINNQNIEILKLNKIAEEGEQEKQKQKAEYHIILSDKNILVSHIIKRNNELNNLYNKIKLNNNYLKNNSYKYNNLMNTLSKKQKNLIAILENNNQLVNKIKQHNVLKNKIIQLDKSLLNEKIKSKALENELEKPINIHRWRILESSDPYKFEKITLIKSLQVDIINKANQLNDIQLLITEKEKVYLELKKILSRQPGIENNEQILIYQQTYKDKQKQLASMNEEIIMYREQIQSFKQEILDIEKQMLLLKSKWFKMKRNEIKSNDNGNQIVEGSSNSMLDSIGMNIKMTGNNIVYSNMSNNINDLINESIHVRSNQSNR